MRYGESKPGGPATEVAARRGRSRDSQLIERRAVVAAEGALAL